MKAALAFGLALVWAAACFVPAALAQDLSYARIKTTMGDIDVALEAERAPISTANFLDYATTGFYDRLIVHRVVQGRLFQGGGYNAAGFPRATKPPIANESANGLSNTRGTIAMARQAAPDSADSQWYINLRDNPELDRTGDLRAQAGYAVFGHVVAGMAVADAIGGVAVGPGPEDTAFAEDFPVDPVVILRIDPLDEAEIGATQAVPNGETKSVDP